MKSGRKKDEWPSRIDSAVKEEKAGQEVKMGVEFVIVSLHSMSHSSDQLPEVHLFLST